MKLLLDQNLSFRFLDQISARFPGSTQASGALKLVGKYPAGKGANWVEIVSFD